MRQKKEAEFKTYREQVKELLTGDTKQYFESAQAKGSSAWLTCLPIKAMGHSLNKRDFQDAISLRYGWQVKGMPSVCSCGKPNDTEHALICPLGGYVLMRHNTIRNVEASLLGETYKDVKIEPDLLPVGNTQLSVGTNIKDQARLDVSSIGLWSPQERCLFDVRITHPNAPSNKNKSIANLLKENENEKMRSYNDRVLQVEKASFVPLGFATSGEMGTQCEKVHKQLARVISEKKGGRYATVMAHIRTRLRLPC